MNNRMEGKRQPPPVIEQKGPEQELEKRLQDDPEDADAKVDVASDQSMDASDPPSVVQPESSEPVPSSSFEEEDED